MCVCVCVCVCVCLCVCVYINIIRVSREVKEAYTIGTNRERRYMWWYDYYVQSHCSLGGSTHED